MEKNNKNQKVEELENRLEFAGWANNRPGDCLSIDDCEGQEPDLTP